MAFFEWQDSYSVNIDEIDQQHMQLIRLINRIYEEMEKINKKRVEEKDNIESLVHEITETISVVGAMIDYASYHFSTEEKHILQVAPSRYDTHKKAHKAFVDKVQKLDRDIKKGEGPELAMIANFAKDWLTSHILEVDRGTFLEKSKMSG